MIQGVAYSAPRYIEPVDPNPPAYEEVPTLGSERPRSLVDEKQQLYRLSTEDRIPPHVAENYGPNTGLDTTLRSLPTPTTPHPAPSVTYPHNDTAHRPANDTLNNLLDAIKLYFDTQIKLNSDKPTKVRHLEAKKTRKLEKAERKYKEYIAKGKDSKHEAKMERRAEKMEKWTEWVLKRSIEHGERTHERANGRHCRNYEPTHMRAGHTEQNYQRAV